MVTLHDFKRAWEQASDWERRRAAEMLEGLRLQERPALTYDDGSWISLHDLIT